MARGDSPRAAFEEQETGLLQEGATKSTNEKYTHRVYPLAKDDCRTEFQRDYTRIIHSRAFRRLRQKTQVFISPKNDHLCTRMEHSLHVASVATTIARSLGLNQDLVAAIAIGHDLGHAPFGHKGEKSLDAIARQNKLAFSHELHSLRVVDFLESPYPEHHGLNLTFAVRDGIACHFGEGFEARLEPDQKKRHDALDRTKRGKDRPATLEGCVVRWADKIAYLGRDLEDALALGLVKEQDIPGIVRERLGTSNRETIASLVKELVRSGIHNGSLSVGEDTHEALNAFYKFNMERIYYAEPATRSSEQIDRAMEPLFEFLLTELQKSGGDLNRLHKANEGCLRVLAQFLEEDIKDWDLKDGPRLIIDFIAGMTDPFFISSFTELFLPRGSV